MTRDWQQHSSEISHRGTKNRNFYHNQERKGTGSVITEQWELFKFEGWMDSCRGAALQLNWLKHVNLYSILQWKELGGGLGTVRGEKGSAGVWGWVWLSRRFPTSRAVCSRKPLGQSVVSGPILGRCGGMGGTSVGVMWCRSRRATVTLIAVVSAASVPVIVGTAVMPLTAGVITLSLESTPVSLENLQEE